MENEVITMEEFEKKKQELEKRSFLAEMSDDYYWWNKEKNMIAVEYQKLFYLAKISGLID